MGDSRDDHVIAELTNTLKDFNFYHVPRINRSGGGLAIILRKAFEVKVLTSEKFNSFENIDVQITINNKRLRLISIYRPPPLKKNNTTTSMFFDEFSNYLEEITISPSPVFICGDFNLHLDNVTNPDTIKFLDLLTATGLIQHVDKPTHRRGHTLDLLITRCDEDLLGNFEVISQTSSDHAVVLCNIDIPRPKTSKHSITFRKTRTLTMLSNWNSMIYTLIIPVIA